MSFEPSFFARVGFPNPLCPQCKKTSLISPVEQKNGLCYVCRYRRDQQLEEWKREGELAI